MDVYYAMIQERSLLCPSYNNTCFLFLYHTNYSFYYLVLCAGFFCTYITAAVNSRFLHQHFFFLSFVFNKTKKTQTQRHVSRCILHASRGPPSLSTQLSHALPVHQSFPVHGYAMTFTHPVSPSSTIPASRLSVLWLYLLNPVFFILYKHLQHLLPSPKPLPESTKSVVKVKVKKSGL